jgi:putative cardiolipin synthase
VARLRCALVIAVAVAACTGGGLPAVDRPPSTTLSGGEATAIGRAVAPVLAAHPGQSGFALIEEGRTAFRARHDLAVVAERGIDAQYYIWESDTSGLLLASALLDAAKRGVRVRILIDDIHTKGKDFDISALDAHPNVEIRVFNPFAKRDARNVNIVTEFERINHRMHNKAFLVDGQVGIVGGRNIGDDYFGVNTVANFRDLDLLAVGPVASDLSASFDLYWNSDWALPIISVADKVPTGAEAQAVQDGLSRWAAGVSDFPYPRPGREEAAAGLGAGLDDLAWGAARVVYDLPAKAGGDFSAGVAPQMRPELQAVEHELLVESAYFVAGDDGVELFGGLGERGVRVRVLTNSLATNDLVPAHAGYTRYREALLERGVELHELRPGATAPRAGWSVAAGRSRAALHTKAMLLDGKRAFVGSFNLTPRSVELNTEVGIIVDSPALAARLRAFMDAGVDGANAWQLALEDGDLRWRGVDDGVTVVRDSEPDVDRWRRFTAWMIRILPVEREL